jgi:hypothetical protein
MKRWLVSLPAAALFSCVAFGSNIVLNPGFETGDFTNWTNTNGNWEVETSSGGVVPHSGTYYADTGCVGAPCLTTGADGAFFFQDLPTTIGDTYTISFWYDLGNTTCTDECVGEGPSDDPNDTFAELEATWGATTIFNVIADDVPDQGWVNFTINAVATSTSTQLEFFGRQDPAQLGVDDVCVDLAGGSCGGEAAVPEPAALLLSGSGLAGFGFLALQRRRRFLKRG